MYEKTEWKARKGTGLNRFDKSWETPKSVILDNAPVTVEEQGTPFSASNMNKIEQGIFDAHEDIIAEAEARREADQKLQDGLSQEKQARAQAVSAVHEILNGLAGLPEWDSSDHVLTFTARSGATLEINLPLEDLVQDVGYDPGTKEIVLTKKDGSEIRIDVSDLIDVYEGSTGSHIQITVSGGNIIKAKLLGGSITETELSSALNDKINSKLDPEHNTDSESHPDIRQMIEDLNEEVNALSPEGMENLMQLLAQKAPIASPVFTGTPTAPTAPAKSNNTQIATTKYVDSALDSCFKIGFIYMSAVNNNPATFLGGTWTVWGSGRVPVGVDTGQSEFNTVEKTGGSKTHTLASSELASHSHGGQPHSHLQKFRFRDYNGYVSVSNDYSIDYRADHLVTSYDSSRSAVVRSAFGNGSTVNTDSSQAATTDAGGGAAHNNLQPYITCYMWKRTA